MNEQQTEHPNVIRVSSTQSLYLMILAACFERNVDLTKYKRDDIKACYELGDAYRAMYEAAVESVIRFFNDAVGMAITFWDEGKETSFAKIAKDVFIQRLSFELPDVLESLFEKLSTETITAVNRHFHAEQTEIGLTPVLLDRLDLRDYQLEWTEAFAQLATTVVIDRIDKMKLDKVLNHRARQSDLYMQTLMELFGRMDLECGRIQERLTCRLKGRKPFSRYSAAVSMSVWSWVADIEEDDTLDF